MTKRIEPMKRASRFALALAALWLPAQAAAQAAAQPAPFAVTDTSVQQGSFEAVARSREHLVTNYPRAAQPVMFKFSLNGLDNEFPPGTDHMIYLRPRDGRIVTPVYTFGQEDPPLRPDPAAALDSEEGPVEVTFRLDLRHVLEAFRAEGSYDPPNGPPIAAEDFEGVYIVGNVEPLTWDFSQLRPGSRFELRDEDDDGIYTVTLPFEAIYNRPLDAEGRAFWRLQTDLSGFPAYTSSQRLVDALYNLSLEELLQNVRDDGALMAGAKWPDVWTRDVSYAIVLALALAHPEAARRSLMHKVDAEGRIIQDTGTGGAWPVSSDRMTWALAAWEIYTVTGDRDWLRTAYDVIRRSAEADLEVVRDPATGLFYGESSFLDWRDQSYPRWMDPKDIYRSQALGTNAVHHATYRILGRMAEQLGEPAEAFHAVADEIRAGMNAYLWMSDRGYYGEYRYGRLHPVLSPRGEALGEALAILYGAASPEQAERIAANYPLVPFGVPTLYPQAPDPPPYHNDSIWPFVEAYFTWAAAEAGNAPAVAHGLDGLYRAAALFLTNKENLVIGTGHFEGTEVNSDRQLWSVAGTLASVYRVLLGLRFEPDRLVVRPFVPAAYAGTRTLEGLRYRDAVLSITVHGFGHRIAEVRLDGQPLERAEVPADLTGSHTLEITLDGTLPEATASSVPNRYAPPMPEAAVQDGHLIWGPVDGAVSYTVYRNGEPVATTSGTRHPVEEAEGLVEYQVQAEGGEGLGSFLSEPVRVVPEAAVQIVQPPAEVLAQEHAGYTGSGYVPLTRSETTMLRLPIDVPEPGRYAIDVRYANGSGPVNSDNRAAVRTLLVDDERLGPVVMPQRGTDLWSDWGYSNPLTVWLDAGRHTLALAFLPSNRNMNLEVNTALLDHVRLTRLATP